MSRGSKIEVSYEETPHGPLMKLTPKGGSGAIFAAEFFNTDGGQRRLLCQWPSLKNTEDYQSVVERHSHAPVSWHQRELYLLGLRKNGEFTLDTFREEGLMPRATRHLIVSCVAPKDQVLEEIVRVAAETVSQPNLLPRRKLRNSLKEFTNRRFLS